MAAKNSSYLNSKAILMYHCLAGTTLMVAIPPISFKSLSLSHNLLSVLVWRESEEEAWAAEHRGFLFFFPMGCTYQSSVNSYQSPDTIIFR